MTVPVRGGWDHLPATSLRPSSNGGPRTDPALDYVRRVLGPEDEPLIEARRRSADLGPLPAPEVGPLLAWAAKSVAAKHVVEVGSAGGISGAWLFRGMDDRGILTSIEPDPDLHEVAARTYADVGMTDRIRSILGLPMKVLPRLTDGGYDLVLLQTQPIEYPAYVEHALRLLRPGGVLFANGTLARVGEGSARDDATEALREFNRAVVESGRLTSAVLTVGTGVTVATLTH